MKNMHRGVGYALVAMVISGVSVFVNKYAIEVISPALTFTATKNAGVGLLVLGLILVSGKWRKLGTLTRGELLKLGLIGVIGGSIPFYLFFTGLAQIPAVNAQLINKSLVMWVALLAIPLLHEKINLWQVGAIGLIYSSNLIVGGFGGFQFSSGELMVLVATMFWAVEHVIAKKVLDGVDADLVTGARMAFGSAILLVAAQISSPGSLGQVLSLEGAQWVWLAVTAGMLFGYVMSWYRAIKYAPVTLVTTVLVGATVVTNVLSAVFTTHIWTGQMGIQAGLIALGIGVFGWQTKENLLKIDRVSVG